MAVVGDGEDRGKTVHLPQEQGFLRLQLIAESVAETLAVWQPAFAAVEAYAYVKNVDAFVRLVEVGTVIRGVLYKQGISWVEVPPTVLKKWTTGVGNAKKDHMAFSVRQRWQFSSLSHDIIDAYALAQMAQLGWEQIQEIRGVSVGYQTQGSGQRS